MQAILRIKFFKHRYLKSLLQVKAYHLARLKADEAEVGIGSKACGIVALSQRRLLDDR